MSTEQKSTDFLTTHFTKSQALTEASKLNSRLRDQGRSSGWGRFDYTVRRTGRPFKRYGVVVRSTTRATKKPRSRRRDEKYTYTSDQFHYTVRPDEEEHDLWTATCTEVPGATSCGRTASEALENAKKAVQVILDSKEKDAKGSVREL